MKTRSRDWHAGFTVGFNLAGLLLPIAYVALDLWKHGWIWRVLNAWGWLPMTP